MSHGPRVLVFAAVAFALAACASKPVIGGPGYADESGSAARGQALASSHCATCHAVRPDEETSPLAGTPPFVELAQTPGLTRAALNNWLHTSHPTMPDFIVSDAQGDDIYAYLITLRHAR